MKPAASILALAWLSLSLPATSGPEIEFRSGKPFSVDGKALMFKDGNVVDITSTKSGIAETIDLILTIPSELTVKPDDISRGGVAIAISGKSPFPIKSAVWLPKSRIWHQLKTAYLPTDEGGVIKLEFPPYLAQIFAEDAVKCSLRMEDFNAGAAPFAIAIDAATTIVATAPTTTSAADAQHHKAAEALNDAPQVQVDVHSFAGSADFDKKREAVIGNWDKSFSKKGIKSITGGSKKR